MKEEKPYTPSISPDQDKIVKEKPETILTTVAKFFKIMGALTDEAVVGLFADAYGRIDPGISESYRMRVARQDFAQFQKSGQLPGYVFTAYKGALKDAADLKARAVSIKHSLGVIVSDTDSATKGKGEPESGN